MSFRIYCLAMKIYPLLCANGMANEGNYPPLITSHTPMQRLTRTEARLTELEKQSNTHTKLLFGLLERDVVVVAVEILKWSMKKRGGIDGDGRHLFDTNPNMQQLVLRGCRTYGEFGANLDRIAVEAFKAMLQVVIKAQNDTAHFQDVHALDLMVKNCTLAISEWPELEVKFPDQIKIILKYEIFKQLLPECFM